MRGAAIALLALAALLPFSPGARADDPIDIDAMPRVGRYASTRSFLEGGEAERRGLEAEQAAIPGAAENAVEVDPEPDAEGNAKWVHFRLEVVEIQEEVYPGEFVTFWVYAPLGRATGSAARAPSPTLRVQEGDRVLVTLYNTHYLPHTIHFHGMDQPAAMDGVPDMSGPWVEPGRSFTYEFVAKHAGTFFYHCHVHEHVHVPMGLGGMVIVEPRRPHNHFARLIPGAGRIAVLGKATAERFQNEYSMVYSDIDHRLNRIPAMQTDVREIERRMHRDYDTTQRSPDIAMLNGRSFPFTLRDTPVVVQPDGHTLLRVLNMGGRAIYLHTHGHHPTLIAVDGRPVPPAAQLVRDTFEVGPAQRIELDLDTRADSPDASGPGEWMIHDHSPAASTNRGIGPGGNHTAIVYGEADAGAAMHMHARYFDPAYYRGEVPVFAAAGHDAITAPPQVAPPRTIAAAPRATAAAAPTADYPQRGPAETPAPRLDLIDAERHRPVASACEGHARSRRRVVLKAGREYARPGEAYAFEPRQLRVGRCEDVELVLENHDAVRHDLMIPGLTPMLTANLVGPATMTVRFLTPDVDVTLPFHCHVPTHDKTGMLGEIVVGKGGRPRTASLASPASRQLASAGLPTDPRAAPAGAAPAPTASGTAAHAGMPGMTGMPTAASTLHDGVGVVLAVLPRQGRVIVKHDDIPGYMAGMEMSFPVARPELMQGVSEGDRVAFKVDAGNGTLVELRVTERPR